jgi:agmatine deiminase
MTALARHASSNTFTENLQSFRFPAEWEPHAATWLAWPHYRDDWPGKFETIPWVYAEIIRHLARHERVELIVNDAAGEKSARKVLDKGNALSGKVRFHRWRTDRVWTRDSGCTFLRETSGERIPRALRHARDNKTKGLIGTAEAMPSPGALQPSVARPDSPFDFAQGRLGRLSLRGSLIAAVWLFNAWSKYPNYKHDEKIGGLMARAADAQVVLPMFGKRQVVLEGGSIDSNGKGTLLTTEECLLSKVQQRNAGMKREDYEKVFSEFLGIKNVIWLGSGIAGDDTHGHVDDITRFVAPDTVVSAVESNPDDANYEPLQENLRRLREATDQDGKPLAIVELPMPAPVIFEKRRLPASYANFYIANGLVLAPVFNDPNDRIALDILADIFPDRGIVGIYSGDLIWGFGAMHCMTQQQPL